MTIVVGVSVEVGETSTDERPHAVTLVQLVASETVVPAPGDSSLADALALVAATLERQAATMVAEARSQLAQVLELGGEE